MAKQIDEKQIIRLYFMTDLFLLWTALSMATVLRMEEFHLIHFVSLERDRWLCMALVMGTAMVFGCYHLHIMLDRFDAFYYTMVAYIVAGILVLAATALVPIQYRMITRREIIAGLFLAGILVVLWHYTAARFLLRFRKVRRFFYVVGDPAEGQSIVREIRRSRRTRANAKYLAPDEFIAHTNTRLQNVRHPAAEAIIALNGTDQTRFYELLEICTNNYRRTYLYPSVQQTAFFHHENLSAIAGLPLVQIANQSAATNYQFLKRLLDVAVAGTLLLLSFPICLFTAMAVGLTSPGGIFYYQERLGRDGRRFKVIKFRSMLHEAAQEEDPVRSPKDDARITPVGRVIRKYKIDELPQLWNVLKGDMSLIGPRPVWPVDFFEKSGIPESLWKKRLSVRPGLTSLLHVKSHSYATAHDYLRYDFIYINNLSFTLDLQILAKTARIVLSGKGEVQ